MKGKRFFVELALLIFFLFKFTQPTLAVNCDISQSLLGLSEKQLQELINSCQQKVNTLKQEINSLSSQIKYMDTQIYLTNLKIKETQERISQAEKEVKILDERISGLDQSIDYLSRMLLLRISHTYKLRPLSLFDIFLNSENLYDFLSRYKYAKITQETNQKLLFQVQQAKLNYEEQKVLREEKIRELDILNDRLNIQKSQLLTQQLEKKTLLEMTRNDEKKYQKLIADAQKELTQILGAAKYLFQSGRGVEIKRGDFIGLQGNTGYSFGDHLHFGVYRYNSISQLIGIDWYHNNWVDPAEVLSPKTVLWDTGCEPKEEKTVGRGSWSWPMEPRAISQGSGFTCYSNVYYRGRAHPAWDMWGPASSPIYAVDDGVAYFCRNCLGDGGNGVFIFHSSGYMTLYWHLQ